MVFRFLWNKAVNHEWEGLMKEKIEAIEGDLIGSFNQDTDLYSSFTQLDEFKSIVFTIVGNFTCKTFKGAEIHLISSDRELIALSDTQEIDTDVSTKMKLGITEIEMDLDNEQINFLKANPLTKITFTIEKQSISIPILHPERLINSLTLVDNNDLA